MPPANGDPKTMSELAGKLEGMGVTAIVLTILDPFLDNTATVRRKILAMYPAALQSEIDRLESLPFSDTGQIAAEWGQVDEKSYPWTAGLNALGYKTWISIKLPSAARNCFEILLLGQGHPPMDDLQAALAAWISLNAASELRRMAASFFVNITAREKQCLIGALRGLTAEEIALEMKCTPRTVRFHHANVMEKLEVNSTVHAVNRAQALGIL
jgi:DNA-binding CsgD family transcriptional regulator